MLPSYAAIYPVKTGAYVLVTVSDTGIMDSEIQTHIFERASPPSPKMLVRDWPRSTGRKKVAATSTCSASWGTARLLIYLPTVDEAVDASSVSTESEGKLHGTKLSCWLRTSGSRSLARNVPVIWLPFLEATMAPTHSRWPTEPPICCTDVCAGQWKVLAQELVGRYRT